MFPEYHCGTRFSSAQIVACFLLPISSLHLELALPPPLSQNPCSSHDKQSIKASILKPSQLLAQKGISQDCLQGLFPYCSLLPRQHPSPLISHPTPSSMKNHDPAIPGLRSKTFLGFKADNGPKPQFSSAAQFTQQGCGVYMEYGETQAGLQATRREATYTHCQRAGLDCTLGRNCSL